MTAEHDMTLGSVRAGLVRFALPILWANLLQSAYGIADMAVVGKFVGSAGLAAVGSAAMPAYIIQSVCTGITMGGTVLVAQYKGARNAAKQAETIGTLFSVSGIAALVLTAASLLVYRPVLALMQVPPAAMQHALDYLFVVCLGTVFVFGYNAVCAVLRGLGDSRMPLRFVAVATAANIALDLLLVGALHMGVRGAAIATVASQGISFGISLPSLRRRGLLPSIRRKNYRIRAETCKKILQIGVPTAVQMTVLNLSYLLVTGLLNGYGTVVAAAASIGLKVNTFAVMPCWAMGQAVTAMAGQNMGAGNARRAVQGLKTGLVISLAAQAVITFFVQLFAAQIVAVFDADPQVIREGVVYLRICCSFNCLPYVVMFLIDSFATGTGHSLFAMSNAMLQSVAIRLPLGLFFANALGLGFIGIYWGECLSPILPAAAGVVYMVLGKWKRGVASVQRTK